MKRPLHLILMCGGAVAAIYLSLVVGEVISTTATYQRLRNEAGVPVTLLRMCVLAATVLPVAFLAGRRIILRSPATGRTALVGVAVAFTVIIGALQIFVYEGSVLGASLLKITFAAAGLALVAYRSPSVER